jgi:phospholipid transport system substrate-binding protein
MTSAVLLFPRFARAAGGADPKDQIARFNAALLGVMRVGKGASFAARCDALGQVVDQVFDLGQILKMSVGPYWRGLPQAQRSTLASVFRGFVLASYVSAFDEYNGEMARVLPDVRTVGALQVVSSDLTRAGDETAITAYVMAESGDTWRVQDILLEGTISRVAMERSDFQSSLVSGDATRLIEKLRSKTSRLDQQA